MWLRIQYLGVIRNQRSILLKMFWTRRKENHTEVRLGGEGHEAVALRRSEERFSPYLLLNTRSTPEASKWESAKSMFKRISKTALDEAVEETVSLKKNTKNQKAFWSRMPRPSDGILCGDREYWILPCPGNMPQQAVCIHRSLCSWRPATVYGSFSQSGPSWDTPAASPRRKARWFVNLTG